MVYYRNNAWEAHVAISSLNPSLVNQMLLDQFKLVYANHQMAAAFVKTDFLHAVHLQYAIFFVPRFFDDDGWPIRHGQTDFDAVSII